MAFPLMAIPAIAGLGQSILGANSNAREKRRMKRELDRQNAENEAWYNKNYYGDYMQRADVQNVIRSMRNQMQEQTKADRNSQAVLGTTDEAVAANMGRRNKTMADLYSRLSAQGQLFKDNVDREYRQRKYGLQGLNMDMINQNAISSGNLMSNGIKGIAETDWASVVNGWKPKGTDVSGVVKWDYNKPQTGNDWAGHSGAWA